MRYPPFIETDFDFPDFAHVRMTYPRPRIEDVAEHTVRATTELMVAGGIRAGDRVAVGVGSRGIANLGIMVGAMVATLKAAGVEVVIVPAMGSHGGATAEGQAAVLHRLGVAAESCGAPVHPSMESVVVGRVFDEVPVAFAREALAADHTIALNRIKPHTKFKGALESGIAKMLCVGLGKHDGALAYHRYALKHGFLPLLRAMAAELQTRTNFRGGVGVVENAYDETCRIEAVTAADMFTREAQLLERAKAHFPRLPFKQLDLLVIGRIGKDISGAGMDPNVTGRAFDLMESDFSGQLDATRVVILDLSDPTDGNATGVGNADIITEKVFDRLDYEATLMNALTSLSLHKAFIPVRMPNERKAIQAGFTTLGPLAPHDVRAVIVQDTAHLTAFLASASLLEALGDCAGAEILPPTPLVFDREDNLVAPWHPVHAASEVNAR
ncbi:MAG: lactate racemase domain-containing protein [Desulfobacterales bacterium]|jgi:hypothetical protein